MLKYIKGPQRQLKIDDICVKDGKALGILCQMSGAEDFSDRAGGGRRLYFSYGT